ncbi:unnamed protein product [Lepidochelys olivacea]
MDTYNSKITKEEDPDSASCRINCRILALKEASGRVRTSRSAVRVKTNGDAGELC